MALVAGVIPIRAASLVFVARLALCVEGCGRCGNELLNRLLMAGGALPRLGYRFLRRIAGMAFLTPLGPFGEEVIVAVHAASVAGLHKARHGRVARLVVTVRARLRHRFYRWVVVARLTVFRDILVNVISMAEGRNVRFGMMTTATHLLVHCRLVCCLKCLIKFLYMAGGTLGWCLNVARIMVAKATIIGHGLCVRGVSENDFAALVVEQCSHWRAFRCARYDITRQRHHAEQSGYYSNGKISFMQ